MINNVKIDVIITKTFYYFKYLPIVISLHYELRFRKNKCINT